MTFGLVVELGLLLIVHVYVQWWKYIGLTDGSFMDLWKLAPNTWSIVCGGLHAF